MDKIDDRIKAYAKKTVDYINSPSGLDEWEQNWRRFAKAPLRFETCLVAAIQKTCRLIKYEVIWAVVDAAREELKARNNDMRGAA